MADTRDTIAAIATATGRSGVGVVRISGRGVPAIIEGIVGRSLPPREAVLARFRDVAGQAIDQGIALYFRGPASYTGEDVLELQGHGGPVVLQLLLKRCLELGARIAAPGEFTQRAFLNDKLDLAQAEGVADLIDATTAAAARSAVRSLEGEFSQRIHSLVRTLIELRTFIEATLDFPEEEGIDFLPPAELQARLRVLEDAVESVLAASRRGSLLREGLRVVLLGEPNVGKSSLLNRLTGEDVAIVADIPGTTRDTIHQAIDLGGVPVYLVDTAGLRPSQDPVEQLGIARAWRASEKADLALVLVEATRRDADAERQILARLPRELPVVTVVNKIDLIGETARMDDDGHRVWISAKEGWGIDLLREALLEAVGWRASGEATFLARERHLAALEEGRANIRAALAEPSGLELVAERLRLAQQALSRIVGEFTADDLLGEIFSRFCIGK